jgi:hypothetical protein
LFENINATVMRDKFNKVVRRFLGPRALSLMLRGTPIAMEFKDKLEVGFMCLHGSAWPLATQRLAAHQVFTPMLRCFAT